MIDLLVLFGYPIVFIYLFLFTFGTILGSFLDVVITRFHTGASINGRSRCMSCGKTLVWYELVPFVSYVILRGRCGMCRSHIPFRLFLMEIVTGALVLLVASKVSDWFLFLVTLALALTLLVVTVYDIEHMVIPDEFVVLIGLLTGGLWFWQHVSIFSWLLLVTQLLTAFGCFAFFAALWFYSKGRWIGFGDAKLAIPLGFVLTPIGALSFVIFSFWIGALVGVGILLTQYLLKRGKTHLPFLPQHLTMKSEVPFAPFMVISFLLVYITQADVLSFMSSILYGSL